MDELQRRMTSATAWGIEAHLLSPAEVKELVPFINEEVIMGGFYCPTVSVVDSLETGTVMRKEAIEKAGLQVFANTEVLDLITDDTPRPNGRRKIVAVETDKGTIEAEHVVIACGVWSNRIAYMADTYIPLVPAVHQMADVGPMDILAETGNEIGYPIVRDMDTFCYERQSSGSMEVGSYGHRAILHHPDDIPSNEEAALSPTEMPFTPDDFDPQMETAIELMDFLGDAEIKYAINGLLSLTPDGMPCLGELPDVENLWSAAAVWVKEGPGMGQVVAEWMHYGYPRVIDAHGADVARFYDEEKSDEHIWSRADESFIKTYGIVHPAEQWGEPPPPAGVAVPQPPRGARRRVLPGPRLGATAVVRVECRPRRALRARGTPRRVGQPLVEPHHRRRAPQPARALRHDRPVGVPDLRDSRAPVPSSSPTTWLSTRSSPGRPCGLHALAHTRGRIPLRPHHACAWPTTRPRRHRRLRRWARRVLGHASTCPTTARSPSPTGRCRSAPSACGARTHGDGSAKLTDARPHARKVRRTARSAR